MAVLTNRSLAANLEDCHASVVGWLLLVVELREGTLPLEERVDSVTHCPVCFGLVCLLHLQAGTESVQEGKERHSTSEHEVGE